MQKINLEIDFAGFTKSLIAQLKVDYEAQQADSVIRRIPLADLEKSIQAVGDAANSMTSINPVAFSIALNHYADCIAAVAKDAIKERNDVRDS